MQTLGAPALESGNLHFTKSPGYLHIHCNLRGAALWALKPCRPVHSQPQLHVRILMGRGAFKKCPCLPLPPRGC